MISYIKISTASDLLIQKEREKLLGCVNLRAQPSDPQWLKSYTLTVASADPANTKRDNLVSTARLEMGVSCGEIISGSVRSSLSPCRNFETWLRKWTEPHWDNCRFRTSVHIEGGLDLEGNISRAPENFFVETRVAILHSNFVLPFSLPSRQI